MSFFRKKHPKKQPVARHKAFTAARCFELLIRVRNVSSPRYHLSGWRKHPSEISNKKFNPQGKGRFKNGKQT